MRKIIQILLLLALCGCDVFSLREAEKPANPSGQASWNIIFNTRSKTLDNLRYFYLDQRNLEKYTDLFDDNFRFYFSAQDINDYNIHLTWNRESERNMLYNLHNTANTVIDSLVFNTISGLPDDTLSTLNKVYRNYKVYLTANGIQTAYTGKMEIQLVLKTGSWRILNWYDYRSDVVGEPATWGKLKFNYAV